MKEKIIKILQGIRPEYDFEGVDNFFEEGMFDSFDLVTLVAELDSISGIKIDGAEMLPENFQNVDAIVALVKRYQAK